MIKQILAITLIFSSSLFSGIAEDTVMDYLNAIGGLDKVSSIDNLIIESEIYSSITMDTSIAIMFIKGNKYWVSQPIQGVDTYIIHNGQKGWTKGVINQSPNWGPLQENYWAALSGQFSFNKSLFTSVLRDYEPDKDTVEFAGFEIWDDEKVSKIKVVNSKAGNSETHFYFSKETKLLKGISISVQMGQQTAMTRITLSDYKEIDGVLIPHQMKSNSSGAIQETTVKKLVLNADIPDSKFEDPTK